MDASEEVIPKPFEEFDDEESFGTVGKSCFTLCQVTTSGHITRPIMEKCP